MSLYTQYVERGLDELDQEKLPALLRLKYSALRDAFDELGPPAEVGKVFLDFQLHLYARP